MLSLNKNYDVVLLDLDETIFDFKKAEHTALKNTLEHFDIEYTEERQQIYTNINLDLWKSIERGEISREELKTKRYIKFFKTIGVNSINSDNANSVYINFLSQCPFLLDGAYEFVERLHKYCKIFLATNGLNISQTGRISLSGIKDITDKAYISENIGFSKPQKEYFDYILNDQNIADKSRVIVLGDSLTSDMLGGKNAGLKTCRYVHNGVIEPSPLCDYQITHYDQFFDILFSKQK